MPSLEDISITFYLPRQYSDMLVAKSLKKPRAMQIIQEWQKQADQFCPLLQHISIKIHVGGHHHPCFVFDCARGQQNQSMTWKVRIWREYDMENSTGGTLRKTTWIAK